MSRDFQRAQEHFADALSWCHDSKNKYFLVNTIVLGAMSMTIQGDDLTGHRLATSALSIAEEAANPSSLAWALCAVADAERLTSPGAADIHLEEALSFARSVSSRWVEGQALLNLAKLCWRSDVEEAAVALSGALVNAERTGNPIQGRQAMRIAALLLGRLGRMEDATLLLESTRRNATALPLAPDVAQGLDEVRATVFERSALKSSRHTSAAGGARLIRCCSSSQGARSPRPCPRNSTSRRTSGVGRGVRGAGHPPQEHLEGLVGEALGVVG